VDSKPFDYKRLDALRADATAYWGFPVTSITLRAADGGCQIVWSSGSAPTITEVLAWGLDHPLQGANAISWPPTAQNKNC